jgi:hypothetical protein
MPEEVSDSEIDILISHKALKVIQFDRKPEESVWSRLNDRLFKYRPDVHLRVTAFVKRTLISAFAEE